MPICEDQTSTKVDRLTASIRLGERLAARRIASGVSFEHAGSSIPRRLSLCCRETRVNPETAVELLRSLRPELERKYGVVELALFGSLARGDGDENSDVDVL